MPENRDAFWTLLIGNLADLKARQEVMTRTLAKLVVHATGKPAAEVLAEMEREADEARRLHEAAMLKDLEVIEGEGPFPPESQSQN